MVSMNARTTAACGRVARRRLVLFLFTVLAALSPTAAYAQRDVGRDIEEAVEWFLGFPSWTIEAYAGLSDHGRLLLQTVAVVDNDILFPPDPDELISLQRALTAKTSFSFGAAGGFTVLPRTTIRLAFNRTSSDLEYENDTGLGVLLVDDVVLDADDIGDLSSNSLSLEVLRYLLPERIKFTPYIGVGVALTWWHLDDADADLIIAGDDDTQTRWGGVGTVGLQYRFSSDWALRAEAATYSVGNPFTGEDSFVTTNGFTIDEPTRVRQTNFRLLVAYTFGRPKRP